MLIIALGGGGEKASLEFWNFYSRLQTRKAEIQDIATGYCMLMMHKKQKLKNNTLSDSYSLGNNICPKIIFVVYSTISTGPNIY